MSDKIGQFKIKIKSIDKQLIYPISLIILLIAYYELYLHRCYPVSEGWHITYAKLLLDGKIPYKDFYYYMPPLDIFLNAVLWQLSMGSFLIFRILRMYERCMIFFLLYNELKKLVKPFYAWFASLMGGVLISSTVYDLMGDYNQTAELLCVLLACAMIHFVHAQTDRGKDISMVVSGGILGLASIHKQTLLASAVLVLFFFLVYYCYVYKESFLRRFLQASGGMMTPVLLCTAYLVLNGAWQPFLEQVFLNVNSKGGSITDIIITPLFEIAKQYDLFTIACGIIVFFLLSMGNNKYKKKLNIFRVLSLTVIVFKISTLCSGNITATCSLMFQCGYFAVCIAVCAVLVFLEYKLPDQNSVLYAGVFSIIFLLLEFYMYQSYNGFSYRWYTETSVFNDLEKLSNVLFILLAFSIVFLGNKKTEGQQKRDQTTGFLVLCVCSFISSYANLISAKSTVATKAMGISASIFIAAALELRTRHNKIKNVFLMEGCLFLCMICMGQKITCAYSWWGTSEAEIYEETYPINVKGLEGFRVSQEQSRMYEEAVKAISDNAHEGSTLMGFPGVTIFNLLTDLDFAGFTPVYFYDVCADKYAQADAELYRNHPPDMVVWYDIPGCLETHEAVFRGGQPCGQRKLIEWFAEEISNYTLICQVQNIYVYKLNDRFPVGYTCIENKNTMLPSTVAQAHIQSGYGYRYDALEGAGTQDAPYLIQSAADLLLFRRMVNSGLDFYGRHVVQTEDIDLGAISNWRPIGIMGSEKYFCGSYDGLGHTIKNLTISSKSKDKYGGFFGQLGGIVKNLGFENGSICGEYIGGIASHAYQNPQIINCYFKGDLVSGDRAGGIADNFAGGKIINCYFEGSIEARSAYGIVSYQADAVIDSVVVGGDPCYPSMNSAMVGRIRGNTMAAECIQDMAELMNDHIASFAAVGLDELNNQSYYNWQFQKGGICFSSETQTSEVQYGFLLKLALAAIVCLAAAFFISLKSRKFIV